jgi:hypothetical protein
MTNVFDYIQSSINQRVCEVLAQYPPFRNENSLVCPSPEVSENRVTLNPSGETCARVTKLASQLHPQNTPKFHSPPSIYVCCHAPIKTSNGDLFFPMTNSVVILLTTNHDTKTIKQKINRIVSVLRSLFCFILEFLIYLHKKCLN